MQENQFRPVVSAMHRAIGKCASLGSADPIAAFAISDPGPKSRVDKCVFLHDKRQSTCENMQVLYRNAVSRPLWLLLCSNSDVTSYNSGKCHNY